MTLSMQRLAHEAATAGLEMTAGSDTPLKYALLPDPNPLQVSAVDPAGPERGWRQVRPGVYTLAANGFWGPATRTVHCGVGARTRRGPASPPAAGPKGRG